ncbi:hypothetical protein DINM_006139 [Dirofilaria immitis]|nr:hypothetical protein [Dirofilaria immitis]
MICKRWATKPFKLPVMSIFYEIVSKAPELLQNLSKMMHYGAGYQTNEFPSEKQSVFELPRVLCVIENRNMFEEQFHNDISTVKWDQLSMTLKFNSEVRREQLIRQLKFGPRVAVQYSPTQSNSSVAVVRRNSTETTISTTIRRNRKRGQMKFSDPQRENSKRTRFSRKCRNYNAERRRNSECDKTIARLNPLITMQCSLVRVSGNLKKLCDPYLTLSAVRTSHWTVTLSVSFPIQITQWQNALLTPRSVSIIAPIEQQILMGHTERRKIAELPSSFAAVTSQCDNKSYFLDPCPGEHFRLFLS